jgi:hypothetical protein
VSEVLPEQTGDDRDTGWGDDERVAAERERADEWYERERPPHHEG